MGTWKILRTLGTGPVAEIYEALTPEGLRVAVKRLRTLDAEDRSPFENQARLLVRLHHPAVVSVLGYALHSEALFGEDRGPCYWMELVEGGDLSVAAKAADAETLLAWFREAVSALSFVHAQGVIHGDLSPANLRIDAEGKLKILDFSVLPGDAAASDLATLPYMAPERIEGRLLPASDVFSLGTIFYELLAGRHPRAGSRTVHDLIHAKPRSLADAAPRLSARALEIRIIDRMIRTDPRERFPDAAAVKRALQGADADEAAEEATSFFPLAFVGAEDAFAAASRALDRVSEKTIFLAIHGPSGAGVTRFRREIAFEAALRGVVCREFPDLHRLASGELARVLSDLRGLPAKGVLAVLDWSEDGLSEEAGRFCSALLTEENAVEAALKNLDGPQTARLLEGFLNAEAISQILDPLLSKTLGNPGRILETLRELSSEGLLRRRALLAGWKDVLSRRAGKDAETPEPRDAADLSRFLRAEINRINALGRYGQALEIAERWFALKADDEPMALKTVKYWFITGWGLHNLGRFAEAEERLKRCVAEARNHEEDGEIKAVAAKARSLLGLAALRRGDASAAVAEFRATLALQPETSAAAAETLRNLSRALAEGGDAPGARETLIRARKIYEAAGHHEGLFWTLIQEGNAFLKSKNFTEAERAYAAAEAAARAQGSDLRQAIAWNNRGFLELGRADLAKALESLDRARDILRYLGNPNDVALNLRELIVAEASLGRWARAEARLRELKAMIPSCPEAREFAEVSEKSLDDLKSGRTAETAASLKRLLESLPPELQVTFVDRGDYRKFYATKKSPEAVMAQTVSEVPAQEVFAAFRRLNEDLLNEEEIPKVLSRLMDAVMQLARAESGFLVLRADGAGGPLPGFEIVIARNVAREELQTDLYAFSLSAVRRALQEGQAVVTDNAVLDPLFRDARSVHLRQLKSIVALPLFDARGGSPIGVFYLDHRLESGLFGGDLLEALRAFAALAALAIQKGRMIEALNANNRELSQRLQVQSRELSRSRIILKNEYSEIVGRSPRMAEVLSLVDRITDSKVPVWIFGESGTGKESIARALHFNSSRAKKPFVTENCGALPESLLESELFGHRKGAFTHAVSDKKGILAYADGGTIFLDEIADMSLALQAKLLRFLQEGEIRPLGSTEVIKVDVRVVSASNKDLAALVADGKFREDLFYRLNGVTVTLPPLRERMEDVPLLVEHFLKKKNVRLGADALRIFMNYAWPGNIRELQNTLETAVLFAENGVIGVRSLNFKPALIASIGVRPRPAHAASKEALSGPAGETDPVLEETLRVIRDNAYHRGNAADALGITRRALYARLKKHGIQTDAKSLKAEVERRLGAA